jgi:hypothetical protein
VNTIIAMFLGILPAVLLVWVGDRFKASAEDEKAVQRWLTFLLGVLALLLFSLLIANSIGERASSLLLAFLMPVICGTVAYLFLHISTGQMVWSRHSLKAVLLFMIVVALLIFLGISGNLTMPGFIIFGGVLLALVWKVWNWIGTWYLICWALQMIFLCVSLRVTDANTPIFDTTSLLGSVLQALIFLIPGLGIIVAARLVYMSQVGDQTKDWRKVIFLLSLAASILLLIGYQIALASVWDVATDRLGGIFLWFLVSISGIATAMVMARFLPGKRKLFALAFALIVSVAMRYAFNLGTYGPEGKWGTSPTYVTECRAETVGRAIQAYYSQHGDYPQVLDDLVPRNLVYIPNPIMIPGQTWCYQGGADYYRLGYVYRQFFSTPASVRIHVAVGNPPNTDWACEDEAAKYPPPPGYYDP